MEIEKVMKRTFILSAAILVAVFSVGFSKEYTATSTEDSIKFTPIEPEYWIDTYLSPLQQDTIKVLLWSNVLQKYIDSIPDVTTMASTMDWSYWFMENEVESVVFLKGHEPLRIPYALGLYYCGVLEEGGQRAIAIVPSYIITTDFIPCTIYSLKGGQWEEVKSFTTTPSLFYGEEEPELSEDWLVQKEGRWMYRDYLDYLKEEDTTLHYVF